MAEWRIPPTDPRLGEMTTARWIFCHQMMMDVERRQIKRFARLLGTDLSMFSQSAEKAESDGFGPVRAFPLAAILNPEAFNKLASTDIDITDNAIPDDAYEEQVAALEKSGMLTEIETLSAELEKKAGVVRTQAKMTSTGVTEWAGPGSGTPPPWDQSTEPEPPSPSRPPGRGRVRMRSGQ